MSTCIVCPGSKPKDAEFGKQVCFACSNRILRHLHDLEHYLPTLSLLKTVGGEVGRKVGFGSQSPANDTVIHHTDWRSSWDELDGHGAIACIHSWARAVREDRDLDAPKLVTVGSEIACLRSNHDWTMTQTWVDEYAQELRAIHSAVRSAANDPVPRSVGRCIHMLKHGECGSDVYELPDASGVKCSSSSCGRIYTGLDYDRLRVAQQEAG